MLLLLLALLLLLLLMLLNPSNSRKAFKDRGDFGRIFPPKCLYYNGGV